MMQTLKMATKRIEKVSLKLEALKALFKEGVDGEKVNNVILETIWDNDQVTVTRALYNKIGQSLPHHAHKDSFEYLVVIKGQHLLRMADVTRIMTRGECSSVPPLIDHTTISLSTDGELLAICVPPEKAYRRF